MGDGALQGNEVINLNTYRANEENLHVDAGDELPPGTVLLHGQYTIDEYLNSGGFGITYKAKDSLGRPVVIKECYPSVMCLRKGTKVAARSSEYKDELSGMITGFVSEAHNLAALTHKNIVHVHQVFEENDTAYMAIDYIEGMDLLERIDMDSERLSAKEIVRLTKRILPAVRYIHSMGMLHRDISPDNILIDATGEPILIDFGAARKTAPSSRRAVSQMKFVKDGYSPQEFYIAGAEQGPWSDIYSLAASLYHAISGEAPEESQKRMSALAQKQSDPYAPLAKRIQGYPPQFLETIDAALNVNPQERIQSAEEWMRRMANRPVTRQQQRNTTGFHVAKPVDLKPEPKKIDKQETLPDLREVSVRKEILSNEKHAKRSLSVGIMSGLAAMILIGSGVVGFLMMPAAISPEPGAGVDLTVEIEPNATPLAPTGPLLPVAIADEAPILPTERLIASDAAARDANLTRAEARTLPELPTSAALGPAARPANLAAVLTPPSIEFPEIATQAFRFEVSLGEGHGFATTLETAPAEVKPAEALANVELEAIPAVDIASPEAFTPPLPTGPVLANQIVGSHWDVDIPFQSELVQIRNSHTIQVNAVSDTADLTVSGAWIKAGATIYTFNGEPLQPETPLSASILSTMNIDPDGFVRSTVRFKDPDTGIIDRGLLAVPVFRQVTLADDTVLEARVQDLRWQLRVTQPASAEDGLEVGDILLGEKSSGIAFQEHSDLTLAMKRLVDTGFDTATFEVRRGAKTLDILVPLSRAAKGAVD
ncbi:MAG: protein kinase [Boseongicola sp.]|nr:protein kinase [Boseongicola sp.]